MKILFDLQSLQSSGSRERGIGRYTRALARSIIEQGGDHDIHILLNKAYPEMAETVMAEFDDLLPRSSMHSFDVPTPNNEISGDNKWRVTAAQAIYKDFIRQFKPDVLHIASLFEGLGDDCICVCPEDVPYVTAVTLYDLIPLLKAEMYLTSPEIRHYYYRKIESLKRADLLLSISEASCAEAIAALHIDKNQISVVSIDSDAVFSKRVITEEQETDIRRRMRLTKPYIMYTGAIDTRKNIDGLVKAFAQLPADVRRAHQLAIVGKGHPLEKDKLLRLARSLGLREDEDFVLTGHASDDDLAMLYNLCKLFVLPSFHEGFGLPVLEAMRCGAAVIGSNLTSIPEVIVDPEAMFCPHSPHDLSKKILGVVSDEAMRRRLIENGHKQQQRFSWAECGKRALAAFAKAYEDKKRTPVFLYQPRRKKLRLAYVSPVKPQKSALADFSSSLIPYLQKHYDIDVVTTTRHKTDPWIDATCHLMTFHEFESHIGNYDRILYHVGNSETQDPTFDFIKRYPGTVVLQDFYLGKTLHAIQKAHPCHAAFCLSLYRSHGYAALQFYAEKGAEAAAEAYPCNQDILDFAQGIILHSLKGIDALNEFYRLQSSERMLHIPFDIKTAEVTSDIARQYSEAIEGFAAQHPLAVQSRFIDEIAGIIAHETGHIPDQELATLAHVIAHNDLTPRPERLFVDISGLIATQHPDLHESLRLLLAAPQNSCRVEPVYFDGKQYRYARRFTLRFLKLDNPGLDDTLLDAHSSDGWIGLSDKTQNSSLPSLTIQSPKERTAKAARA